MHRSSELNSSLQLPHAVASDSFYEDLDHRLTPSPLGRPKQSQLGLSQVNL